MNVRFDGMQEHPIQTVVEDAESCSDMELRRDERPECPSGGLPGRLWSRLREAFRRFQGALLRRRGICKVLFLISAVTLVIALGLFLIVLLLSMYLNRGVYNPADVLVLLLECVVIWLGGQCALCSVLTFVIGVVVWCLQKVGMVLSRHLHPTTDA